MSAPSEPLFASLNKVLIALVLVGAVTLAVVFLRPEMAQQQVVDAEIEDLQQLRDAARKTRDEHQRKLDWVRNDPEYLELVARDVLDLYTPGEVILRLER